MPNFGQPPAAVTCEATISALARFFWLRIPQPPAPRDLKGRAVRRTQDEEPARAGFLLSGWDLSECSPDGAQRNPGIRIAESAPDCAIADAKHRRSSERRPKVAYAIRATKRESLQRGVGRAEHRSGPVPIAFLNIDNRAVDTLA